MKPYYEDDSVTIYHGDCREIVPDLPARSAAVLTDPPFFMPAAHYSSRTTWSRSWGDALVLGHWWASILDIVKPAMTEAASLLTFCDDESYPVFYPEVYRRFDAVSAVVWDKQSIGMGSTFRRQFELVLFARMKGAYWDEREKGTADIVRCPVVPSTERLHPVDKPTQLLARLLTLVTRPGDTVLDPFMGGGSTLRAAKDHGRKSIGIEIEEKYCEIAVRRLSQDCLDFGGVA